VTDAPSFVTVSGSSSGTGTHVVTLSVAANAGADRSGVLSVAGQRVSITQTGQTVTPPPPAPVPPVPPTPPTPTGPSQNDAVGHWTGTITAKQPCSVGVPWATYKWTATIKRDGEAFAFVWWDSFIEETRTVQMPVLDRSTRDFTFTSEDEYDTIVLDGRFSEDWQRLSGTVSGHIDCVTKVEPLSGTFEGKRTGS
jgi:hypothetical protein